ncbi:MAG: glycosyl transferase family 90 [Planctomycetia bacterium]
MMNKFKLSHRISTWLHEQLRPLKRFALECRAAEFLWPRDPRFRLPIRDRQQDGMAGSVVIFEKDGGRLREMRFDREWLQSRGGFTTAWRRVSAMLDILADRDIPDGAWPADLGDWVRDEGRTLGFSSCHSQTLLVPDRGFQSSRGYTKERRRSAAAPPFESRDPAIVWRGSPSGQGLLVDAPFVAGNPLLRQRIRLCLLSHSLSGDVDARLILGDAAAAETVTAFRETDILGEPISQSSWSHRRFAIDIDGNSNAFSNLFIRLIYGCCIIKVASPVGFRQWYYDRLEPWVHYVPVAADLSDFSEAIAWCRSHSRECGDIAAAGQALAASMTVDAERRRVIDGIVRRTAGQGLSSVSASAAALGG